MKNKLILVIIVGIILMMVSFFIYKQINIPSQNISVSKQSDFNLIFKYGVGSGNELNTFDQAYTKDMVMDPSIKIKFKLTDSELAGIYRKINDLKVFDKNEDTTKGDIKIMRTPCSSYYLKIQIDSIQKEISWNDCQGEINGDHQQFIDYIIPIIESKEEYKKLPTPKGGYL